MNRSDRPSSTIACLGFTNLKQYQTHPPPYFGTGIRRPMFASTPMRTAFARGNETIPSYVKPRVSCCDNYQFTENSNWQEISKMMRCKKDF